MYILFFLEGFPNQSRDALNLKILKIEAFKPLVIYKLIVCFLSMYFISTTLESCQNGRRFITFQISMNHKFQFKFCKVMSKLWVVFVQKKVATEGDKSVSCSIIIVLLVIYCTTHYFWFNAFILSICSNPYTKDMYYQNI